MTTLAGMAVNKLRVATADDDRAYHGPGATDLSVGFYIDPSGKPQPSAGARLWAASELARVLGPDAVGVASRPTSPKETT